MDKLEQAVKNLQLPVEGEEADWLGRLSKVIRDLNDKKRTVMDELPGPVDGKEYRVVESRSAKRSYNSAAILSKFHAAGYSLHDLRNIDAVRMQWRWTQLKRAAEMANVPLHIEHHEIEDSGDVDGALIGEVWNSRYSIEAVTPDE